MRTSHNLYGLSYGKPSVPFFELYAFLKTFLRKVRTYCPSAMRVLEDQAKRLPVCAGMGGGNKVFQTVDVVVAVE
jgi:hypothetical protein